MEKWDARLFQIRAKNTEDRPEADDIRIRAASSFSQNIVKLESQRELRRKANEIVQCSHSTIVTTSELRQQLQAYTALFGSRFALHMAYSLQDPRHNQADRQAIIWLLTLLNDKTTVPLLQHISNQQRHTRAIRLAASLALAGMGATLPATEDAV